MLERTEKRLSKDPVLKAKYVGQVDDFQERGVLRKLSVEECEEWTGPVRYVSHHEVYKESDTTPVRLAINSSFKTGREKSFNNILKKGPSLLNDLLCILLRFRDISKMYHSVKRKH